MILFYLDFCQYCNLKVGVIGQVGRRIWVVFNDPLIWGLRVLAKPEIGLKFFGFTIKTVTKDITDLGHLLKTKI